MRVMKKPPALPREHESRDSWGLIQQAIRKVFANQEGGETQTSNSHGPDGHASGTDADGDKEDACIWNWSFARRRQAIQGWFRELEEWHREQLEEGGQHLWDVMQELEEVRWLHYRHRCVVYLRTACPCKDWTR